MREIIYRILTIFHPFFQVLYRNRLRVLAYHTVPDKTLFDLQLHYLSNSYNLIDIQDLRLYLQGKKALPKYPLLITFDDGDISVFENGKPALEKYEFPSCLFIITSLINTNKEVWIKRVEVGEMAKGKSYKEARSMVKNLKNVQNKVKEAAMSNYPEISKKQLNTKMLQELQKSKMSIGNHSHTHPMFDKCSREELNSEIEQSKEIFNTLKMDGYSIFAYPNGNEDRLSEEILIEAGMEMIFLFDHKVNSKQINPFRISRIKVDTDIKLTEFKAKVSGIHPLILQLKKKVLG
jgi:poly-beta-1,6-N-acetyl-D-glucosamine N-deacetylase